MILPSVRELKYRGSSITAKGFSAAIIRILMSQSSRLRILHRTCLFPQIIQKLTDAVNQLARPTRKELAILPLSRDVTAVRLG
jgi:hypothetical protein